MAGMPELIESEATKQMDADKHPAFSFVNYSSRASLWSAHQALVWYHVLCIYDVTLQSCASVHGDHLLIPVPYIKQHCI